MLEQNIVTPKTLMLVKYDKPSSLFIFVDMETGVITRIDEAKFIDSFYKYESDFWSGFHMLFPDKTDFYIDRFCKEEIDHLIWFNRECF